MSTPRGGRGRGAPRGGPPSSGRGGPPSASRGGPPSSRGRGGYGQQGAPSLFLANTPAVPDTRLSDIDQLSASFRKLKATPELPLRPGFGTLGKPITLRANFFALKLPQTPIFDYAVEIRPKTDINRLKTRIFELLERTPQLAPHAGHIAHDRSGRLVSAKTLPQPLQIPVVFIETGDTTPRAGATTYTVSISFVRDLEMDKLEQYLNGKGRDYDPLPLISALNLVLQQHPSRTGVRVGQNRHFFKELTQRPLELGLGVEAWKGFTTSVRPVYKQLMVNMNNAMTPFYMPGNLGDALNGFMRNTKGAMPRSFYKGFKVTTSHLGYKPKKGIKAIGNNTARKTFFDHEGKKMSVEAYFKKAYNITLKHPDDLPVVNLGSRLKDVFVPAELCEIEPGQAYRGKLNELETANMIKYACNPPTFNANAIVNEGFPTLGWKQGAVVSPVKGFGISIDPNMAVIPGRELPAPRLTYGSGSKAAANGAWNIVDVKFNLGGKASGWSVFVVRDGPSGGPNTFSGPQDPNFTGLVEGFANKCRSSGIALTGPPRVEVSPPLLNPSQDPSRVRSITLLRDTLKAHVKGPGAKPQFILVLLSRRDNFIYPAIKRICDVELGVHTIHMLLSKALCEPKRQDQYLSNIALKVNSKLGGRNHLLDADSMKWLTSKRTMMVGIDVTHPGPGSVFGTPSIAAVVGSVDQNFVQYPASLGVQEGRVEMVQDLKAMLVERIQAFEKASKSLPERIFLYRDGVSEGQFQTVLDEELPKIFDAFRSFNTATRKTPFRPKLSIIICGKRHHARFYPTDSQHADKNGNTVPGTIVDKGIGDVYAFDFYLQAHAGLQGTVRPTHYTVIYDENALQADEIQQGTHTASYQYARATKAVSLVPAAYYADIACERGRAYLNEFLNANEDGKSVGGKSSGSADREGDKQRVYQAAVKAWGQGVHPNLRGSMFYI